MIKEVKVVNRNPETFSDAHLGIQYVFEPGKPTVIPVPAAVHIFGLGLEDKSAAFRRLGFADIAKGKMFFNNFDIDLVKYVRKDDAEEIETLRLQILAKEEETAKLLERVRELEEELAAAIEEKGHKGGKR